MKTPWSVKLPLYVLTYHVLTSAHSQVRSALKKMREIQYHTRPQGLTPDLDKDSSLAVSTVTASATRKIDCQSSVWDKLVTILHTLQMNRLTHPLASSLLCSNSYLPTRSLLPHRAYIPVASSKILPHIAFLPLPFLSFHIQTPKIPHSSYLN